MPISYTAMLVVRHLSQRLVLLKFLLLYLLSVGVASCSLKTSVEDLAGISDKPTISISDLNLVEGTSGNVVFTLSRVWTSDIVIAYSSSNSSAIAPGDYTSISGNLTIAAGQTSATLAITTIDDLLYEGDEDFELNLSVPNVATFGSSALSVSKSFEIIDNES
ncbi:MAG: Calx-beta domain-containing protein, partial [Bdellovibrionota bacterium]